MTEPEKMKARQLRLLAEQEKITKRLRIETILVGVLMIVIAGSTIFAAQENEKQDECIARNFASLSETLKIRGELSQRDSDAVAKVLTTAASDKNTAEELGQVLDDYTRVQKEITEERNANPIPPFPTGKCD